MPHMKNTQAERGNSLAIKLTNMITGSCASALVERIKPNATIICFII